MPKQTTKNGGQVHINKEWIGSLIYTPGDPTTYYRDTEAPGLMASLTLRHGLVWFHRDRKTSKRTRIGYWPDMPIEEARQKAQAICQKVNEAWEDKKPPEDEDDGPDTGMQFRIRQAAKANRNYLARLFEVHAGMKPPPEVETDPTRLGELTDEKVAEFVGPNDGRAFDLYYDRVPGLILQVLASGFKTWRVRPKGALGSGAKIGNFPGMGVDEARAVAQERMSLAA